MQSPQSGWPVLSGRMPPMADSFVSRQDTGLSLADSLPAGETVLLVPDENDTPPDLRGLGGTGKTSFAAAIAHAHWRQQMVDLVVWVPGTGRDAVANGYAQALRDVGVPVPGEGPEQAAASFLRWLRNARESWLVVFDDLRDPLIIEELWPEGPGGRVLVTTEYPGFAERVPRPRVVPVGPYSPREALAFLFAKLNTDPGQRVGALDLATGLGLLPVALTQAAAVLTSTGIECREYLARAAEWASHLGRPAGSGTALTAPAWSLSAGYADQLPPAGLAWRVLAFMSMLSPGGIPGVVLTGETAQAYLTGQADPDGGAAQIQAAVHNLAQAGLVSVDPGSAARTVLVHPLVQAHARQRLSGAEHERTARAAADAVAGTWPQPDLPPDVGQALRDCTAQLREVSGPALWAPECQLALLRAGQSLDSGQMPAAAASHWRTMLSITQQALGPGHEQTAMITGLLAAACENAGRFDEAAALYEEMLADREQRLGSAHPDTMAARLNLTRAYRAGGRVDDALQLTKQVAAESEQSAGPAHPDSLAAQEEHVRACLSAGQVGEAVTAALQVRAAREQSLGPAHPATLAAGDLLADTYQKAGRAKDALVLRRRGLAERERALGPGHEDTLTARAQLALAYRLANKPKDALACYERVLGDREQLQGPDHPDTITARAELAYICYAARKFPQSIAHYERVVADCERVFGPGHPRTRRAVEDLNEASAGAQRILGIDLRTPVKRG